MKYLVPVLFLLAACGGEVDTGLTTAVQVPPLPENLAQKRGPLNPNNDVTMGGLVKENTNNIRQYNSTAFQVNSLIDLYNCVKDAVNNKTEIKCQ